MNNLVKMPVMKMFKDKYEMTHTDVILNSITVVALKGNCFDRGINFEIKNISGELVIYPLEKAEEYLVKYDRLVDSKYVIKPENLKLGECRLVEIFGL